MRYLQIDTVMIIFIAHKVCVKFSVFSSLAFYFMLNYLFYGYCYIRFYSVPILDIRIRDLNRQCFIGFKLI